MSDSENLEKRFETKAIFGLDFLAGVIGVGITYTQQVPQNTQVMDLLQEQQ